MTTGDKSPPSTPTPKTQPPHASSYQLPLIALLIYPITLLIGSLYSSISPTARAPDHAHPAPLAPSIATDINFSSPPESPVNYFARKDNIFNVYFVKIGWLWLTLAFASLLISQPTYRQTATSSRRITQAIARYTLATTAWYLMTQWFFGPPVIDRSFVITGGGCERVVSGVAGAAQAATGAGEVAALETVFTAAACKAAGGKWAGGHDVSGHVFMLVVVTGVLCCEGVGVAGSFLGRALSLSVSEEGNEKDNEGGEKGRVWALRFVVAVAGLGWWMLFMTAIWFHTWLEKVCLCLLFLTKSHGGADLSVVWIDDCIGFALWHLLSAEKVAGVEGCCWDARCLSKYIVSLSMGLLYNMLIFIKEPLYIRVVVSLFYVYIKHCNIINCYFSSVDLGSGPKYPRWKATPTISTNHD